MDKKLLTPGPLTRNKVKRINDNNIISKVRKIVKLIQWIDLNHWESLLELGCTLDSLWLHLVALLYPIESHMCYWLLRNNECRKNIKWPIRLILF